MATEYNFRDEWEITAPIDKAWDMVSASADWQRWWPGLKSAVVTKQKPQITGSSVKLIWRSKTGYQLRHRITITSIDFKKHIGFTSQGDLVGYGSWRLTANGQCTHMVIDWHVRTTKPWMNWFSFILRPIFIHNHRKLMGQGELGLNTYLHNTKTRKNNEPTI